MSHTLPYKRDAFTRTHCVDSRTPSATDMLRRGTVAARTCHTAASDACCNKGWHELHERSRRDILLAATARRYAPEAPGRSLLPQRQIKKQNRKSNIPWDLPCRAWSMSETHVSDINKCLLLIANRHLFIATVSLILHFTVIQRHFFP